MRRHSQQISAFLFFPPKACSVPRSDGIEYKPSYANPSVNSKHKANYFSKIKRSNGIKKFGFCIFLTLFSERGSREGNVIHPIGCDSPDFSFSSFVRRLCRRTTLFSRGQTRERSTAVELHSAPYSSKVGSGSWECRRTELHPADPLVMT